MTLEAEKLMDVPGLRCVSVNEITLWSLLPSLCYFDAIMESAKSYAGPGEELGALSTFGFCGHAGLISVYDSTAGHGDRHAKHLGEACYGNSSGVCL